ncbi:MAG: DUF3822 family protein [Brumimicrobium sp.]|nr:DUF3822 family protein [Brumimicrobium sp.]
MSNIQLAIFISKTSVSIAEVFRSNQTIHWQKDFELLESNAEGYRTQLTKIFSELDLSSEYSDYSLAWSSPKQALIPLTLFNESTSVDLYHLLFGDTVDANMIDFSRLMELSMVSIYEIPDWVKSFFVIKFPTIVFKHEHAITLRALFQKNTFNRKVIISVCDDYINLAVIQHNELKFSNTFECQTADDIVYHVLYVIEKEKLNTEKGELFFLYSNEKTLNAVQAAQNTIKNLHKLGSLALTEADSSIKLQTLCV